MTTTTFRDVELLSAYIDGALKPSEAARLEARLRADPGLQAVMDDLRAARGVLRKLPSRRAPRNFTLTPRMAGIKPPVPRSFPALRFASALATLLLVFTFAINALSRPIGLGAYAPANQPAFGMGGGGGPEEGEAPAAEPSVELAPQATQEAADSTRLAPTATAELLPKGLASDAGAQEPATPIPSQWQLALLVLALLLAGAAWLVRFMNDRTWRSKK